MLSRKKSYEKKFPVSQIADVTEKIYVISTPEQCFSTDGQRISFGGPSGFFFLDSNFCCVQSFIF